MAAWKPKIQGAANENVNQEHRKIGKGDSQIRISYLPAFQIQNPFLVS